jgi:ADP-ribosyl-[dinitrogen reductase] hydrolase
MRLAPVAIRFFGDRVKLRDVAARQSKTTHAAPEAVDACVAYAELLADAIQGKSKTELLKGVAGTLAGKIGPIINGSWRAKKRADIKASGYVAHSLEASLWSFARTGTFKSAVLTSANLGDDADTTGAICGQLAGTFFGIIGIPVEWRNRISSHKRIEQLAIANFQN